MNNESRYNQMELIACVGSRILEDKRTVLVGTGLPVVSAMLAQKTHAPDLFMVFEAGGMGALVPSLPRSVGGSKTMYRALMANSMDYVMSSAQLGFIDFGFLGAAQLDMYGNINTTVIGPHDTPKVRLPGSGGANDLGSLCWRTIIIMQQDARKFVKKLDFLTTPGYLDGPGAREKAGLPRGTGPYRVVTQLGVMGFDGETKRMELLSTHPGVTVDDVKANCSFELLVPNTPMVTEPPTDEELRILRTKIDPEGLVLGRR